MERRKPNASDPALPAAAEMALRIVGAALEKLIIARRLAAVRESGDGPWPENEEPRAANTG